MRRQSVQVPRHIGAWIAKWLFVVAALTMPIVFGAASGHAQDFANQPQVQAAIQEVVDATKEAVANIPASDAIKKAEDALDAAIRNNEDISDQPHADNEKENERREKKRNAKEAQNKAETAAEDARAKAADAERTRATNYREALAKRRAARKKLQAEEPAVRDAAARARTAILRTWSNRVKRAITDAEAVITPATQTSGVPVRLIRINLSSPAPRPFPAPPGPVFAVDLSGGGMFANLPDNGFLARELQGSGVQQFNQVSPTRSATGGFGQFKVAVNDVVRPQDRFYFVFNYFNVDASSSGGVYDPGNNHRLNIPGPTGGASGFSLGANPLNQVTNITYSNNMEGFGGGGGVRLPFFTAPTGTTIDGIIGVGGNRLTMDESFGGQIPGFNRDFSYTTNVNVNSATLDLGIGLTQVMSLPPGSGIVIFNGEVTVTPGHYSGSGTDRRAIDPISAYGGARQTETESAADAGADISLALRLNFTGFNPSSADLDNDLHQGRL